jgi:hypothetical protein
MLDWLKPKMTFVMPFGIHFFQSSRLSTLMSFFVDLDSNFLFEIKTFDINISLKAYRFLFSIFVVMFDFTFNIRQIKTQFICHVTNVRFHHEIFFLSRYCFVYDSVFKNKLSYLQRKNNKKWKYKALEVFYSQILKHTRRWNVENMWLYFLIQLRKN